MVDGLITRLKYFLSGIEGTASHLRLLLSAREVFTLEVIGAHHTDHMCCNQMDPLLLIICCAVARSLLDDAPM